MSTDNTPPSDPIRKRMPTELLGKADAPHYGGADNPYEAIKVIEAWGVNFSLGSALKYISRHGKKPGADAIHDLRKAAWYCSREAARLEGLLEQVKKWDHHAFKDNGSGWCVVCSYAYTADNHQRCPAKKKGQGFCDKAQGHEGEHNYVPPMS